MSDHLSFTESGHSSAPSVPDFSPVHDLRIGDRIVIHLKPDTYAVLAHILSMHRTGILNIPSLERVEIEEVIKTSDWGDFNPTRTLVVGANWSPGYFQEIMTGSLEMLTVDKASVILLVRCRQELTEEIVRQLKEKYGYIMLIDVAPRTPEELLELCQKYGATAVLLRQNPLPKLAMENDIPCILVQDGPLNRLESFELATAPL